MCLVGRIQAVYADAAGSIVFVFVFFAVFLFVLFVVQPIFGSCFPKKGIAGEDKTRKQT